MSDLLTSVGSFISSDAKPLTSLLSLAGLGTNLYSGVQQVQQQNQLQKAQSYVNNLVQNPAKMATAAAGYTAPLTAGLTDELSNQVGGSLAERGLGSSPAAYTSALTQAIAPYVQQNQTTGMQSLLSALGLTTSNRNFAPPFANISKLLAQLKMPSNTDSSAPMSLTAPPSEDFDISSQFPFELPDNLDFAEAA